MSCYWPDFSMTHMAESIAAFAARDRRFGGVAEHGVAS
ncbi:MAG: undecaprenyl diphosphate synthase family protein [Mesorhizobium sp.]|nr:undecaprenyl diphosphate synthase family protein [Mesorhizobium sp.]